MMICNTNEAEWLVQLIDDGLSVSGTHLGCFLEMGADLKQLLLRSNSSTLSTTTAIVWIATAKYDCHSTEYRSSVDRREEQGCSAGLNVNTMGCIRTPAMGRRC